MGSYMSTVQSLLSLLTESETRHSPVVEDFLQWWDESFLLMNIPKTTNMFSDFRKHPEAQEITFIRGQTVE